MYNIEELKKASLVIVEKNQLPEIKTRENYGTAGDIRKMLINKREALETERKTYTDPLLKTQKKIKAEFDKAGEPLDNAIETLTAAMKVYWPILKAQMDEQQKKLDEEAMKNAGTEGILVPIVNDVKTTSGDFASSTMRVITKYILMDHTLAPAELVEQVGDKKIADWVEVNHKAPPGFKAEEELSLISR